MRIACFVLFFLALPFALHHKLDHFSSRKIIPATGHEITCGIPILNQPFLFLNQGNQSYVFASQDGQYVLKFFRNKRPRNPISRQLHIWYTKVLQRKTKLDAASKIQKTLNAAKIAYSYNPEGTGVVAIHLHQTDGLPAIAVQDKQGRAHSIPLDRYCFVLQKRAQPFKEGLNIDSFLALLKERTGKGIRNSDPNLAQNFGFINGQCLEIDFGNYTLHSFTPEARLAHIGNYVKRLEEWLEKNDPERIPHLRARFSELQTEIQ